MRTELFNRKGACNRGSAVVFVLCSGCIVIPRFAPIKDDLHKCFFLPFEHSMFGILCIAVDALTESHPEQVIVEGSEMTIWIHINPNMVTEDSHDSRSPDRLLFTCQRNPGTDECQVMGHAPNL